MNEVQAGVRDFHLKCGALVNVKPTIVPCHRLLLRSRLIVEESAEFVNAASCGDMVSMADALADLLYVIYGTAVELGVDMEPISREVQRSNMTKGGGQDEAGKIGKGSNFTPPDIKSELIKQGYAV
jgi:predicted HAD superfamily Cof-like phosphohydrolase